MKKNSLLSAMVFVSSWMAQTSSKGILESPSKIAKNNVIIQPYASSRAEHYHQYLMGSYHHATGNFPKALLTYKSLLKKKPSPHAYNDFFELLFNIGQFDKLIKLYEAHQNTFNRIFTNDVNIQLIRAQSYLSTNNEGKAEEIFMHLSKEHPDNPHVAFFAASAFVKNNQLDKAHNLIEQCLKNPALKQRHFLFHFLNSKAYVQQNNLSLALHEIEKSLQLFPRFDRGWLFKAILLEQMGKINDAISGYQYFLDLVGNDPMVEKQVVQLLLSQKRFDEASKYLQRAHATSPDYHFDAALAAFQNGNDKKAYDHVKNALALDPEHFQTHLLNVEILLHQNKIDQLMSFMSDWICRKNCNPTIIHTLLLLRKANVNASILLKTLQEIEHKRQHPYIFAAIADLAMSMHNHKQAIEYYHKVIDHTGDNGLKSKTLFHIGYIHFTNNQHDKAEEALTSALTHSPVYPSAYNLLAYHYALDNKNLDRALEFSDKALAIAPECYYFIDTKGFILHKQGKKDDAIKLFKQALNLSPHDTTIQQHLKDAQEGL